MIQGCFVPILLFFVGAYVKQCRHIDSNCSHKVSIGVNQENLQRNASLNLFIVSFMEAISALCQRNGYFVAAVTLEVHDH